jgi:hypothetical protein
MSKDSPTPQSERPRWVELERIVSLEEAEQLTSLSHDTLRRRFPNLIVALSPRRVGIRLRDVLAINNGTGEAA